MRTKIFDIFTDLSIKNLGMNDLRDVSITISKRLIQ